MNIAAITLVASMLAIPDAPFGKFEVTVPEFAARDFSIADFGAKEGVKATEAFAAAMAECEKSGGGRVVVPEGRWLTGAVHFRNNCNLHLAEGATLEFTDDPADYPEVFTTWEGVECWNHSPLLYAFGVTNVAITGAGTIAPRMDRWRTWFERTPEHMKATEHLYYWCSTNAPPGSRRLLALDRAHMRPHLIQFNRCGNVLLDGFKIRESPFWMIHLYHSENCVVRNLDTRARGRNNDGVDIDMTKNVLVENCRFDQGDDGIVLKAGRNADGWRLGRCTENVVVRDCDLVNCHSLLGIGSELSGGIRNVWMTRCTVEDTYSMLRIKTGPRRGGFVENIFMDHCRGMRMIRVFNIFTGYTAQWGRFPDFELRRTMIRNVNISDCDAALAYVGVELLGDRLMPPGGIRVENVRIGRVVKSLSDVRNCLYVDFDGLSLLSGNEMPVVPKPRLFFAGDSTLDDNGQSLGGTCRDPYRSWGTALQEHMAAGCAVRNYARSGASTKSFMKSGWWGEMMRDVKPGDYVAIQFGHNDQKRSSEFYLNERWADPKGAFRDNVRSMVGHAREMGATPLLLSPICRGTFDADGKRLVDAVHASDGVCLGSYREAMKELSVELGCDYVDMNGLTRELMERVGRDEAMKFFVISTGLVAGKDGEPSKDVTHPVRAGAEAFAKLFVADVKRRGLPVAELFEDATADLQSRIDGASAKGGGVVRIEAGEYETAPFVLRDNVTLELAEGAVLYASTNKADYPMPPGGKYFISAGGATNVAIVGKGVIDGRGGFFREQGGLDGASQPQHLPVLMRFSRCRDVRLEDFTYRNGAAWGCHLKNCDGVAMRRVKCFNHVNNTNDGIDIESANVVIEDCDIDADDDAVAFKTESDKSFAVTNVVIRNCRLASCCNAVKFGTGSYGDVRDVKIENCRLRRAAANHRFNWRESIPGVTNGICGISGLALEVVDGGRMENVKIRDIEMDGYQTPVFIRHHRRHAPPPGKETYLRNILLENVRGAADSRIASSITGVPGLRPANITLRNVMLSVPGGGTREDAAAEVPEKETDYPESFMFDKIPLPAHGFYVRHADAVRFENVAVVPRAPDAREAFVFDDCRP